MSENMSKSSYDTAKLEDYRLDEDGTLPKKELKNLTEGYKATWAT